MLATDTIRVGQLFAPGLYGSNITLSVDPAAVSAMPSGYLWSAVAPDVAAGTTGSTTGANSSRNTSWVIPVAVIVGAAGTAVVGGIGLVLWGRRRRKRGRQGKECSVCKSKPCTCLRKVKHRRQKQGRTVLAEEVAVDMQQQGVVEPVHDSLQTLNRQQEQPGKAGDDERGHQRHSLVTAGQQSSRSEAANTDNIASGLTNWRRAVSATMLMMFERRVEAASRRSSQESDRAALVHTTPSGSGIDDDVPGAAGVELALRRTRVTGGGSLCAASPETRLKGVVLEEVLGRVSGATVCPCTIE